MYFFTMNPNSKFIIFYIFFLGGGDGVGGVPGG